MDYSNNAAGHDKPVRDEPTLFKQTVKGGVWVSLLQVVTKVLDVLKVWLLANVLGLSNWGLLSLAVLAIAIINTMTQTGFTYAIIHKRDDSRAYLDTAWTTGLIRSFLLGAILYVFAGFMAGFFDGPLEFSRSQVNKPNVLAVRLQDQKDAASRYIIEGASDRTQRLLDDYDGSQIPSPHLEQTLVEELNRVIGGGSLYGQAQKWGLKLSDYAQRLAVDAQKSGDFLRLNRRILQEAYPGIVKEAVIDVRTLTNIFKVLSLYVILGGLGNIGIIGFKKEMQFHKQFVYDTVSKLIDITVTVGVLAVYRSLWALVWGRLVSAVFKCIWSYVIHSFRPRFAFDWSKAVELWVYGRWITILGIISFIMTNGDNLFVAKFLGPAMLGVYLLGYKVSQMAATEITLVFAEVTFPAFSKLQNDICRLRKAYLKVYHFTAFITIPVCGFVFATAPDLVHLFMKKEFAGMIPVIQILAFSGVFHSLSSTMGPVYRGFGEPGKTKYLLVVRLALLCLLIYPLTAKWGIAGTAMTVLLIGIMVQPIVYYLLIKTIHCKVRDIVRAVVPPLVSTAVMVIVITSLKHFVFAEYSYLWLLVLVAAGVVSYLAIAYIFERLFDYQIREIIAEQAAVLIKK